MNWHRLQHIKIGLWLLFGITMVMQPMTTASSHLFANLIALDLCKRFLPAVVPLHARDLLGLDVRTIRNDYDETVAQLDSLMSSLKKQHELQLILHLRNMTLLLAGKPESVISNGELLTSDVIAQLDLAVAYGQTHQLDKVAGILMHMPQGVTILQNAAHSAWDNRLEPDLALAITAGEMLVTLHRGPPSELSDIYQILSYAHEKAQNRERAIVYAKKWIENVPNDCKANAQIVALYLRSYKPVQALQELNRWSGNGGAECPAFPGQLAQVYDQQGDLQRALPLYRESVARNPDDPYINWYLGEALYRYGDSTAALPYLRVAAQSGYPDLQRSATNLLNRISQSPKK